jgi:hypothetical protein
MAFLSKGLNLIPADTTSSDKQYSLPAIRQILSDLSDIHFMS